eukprot:CCRYP_003508-RD/>CCRYP_003508-RD protein AED:0.39 eAED:0.39 QI:64/0.83/0.71/1/1/0.85/7/2664/219
MLAASFKKIISMSALVNVAYHSHTMRWMLLATGQRLLASAFSTETTRGTTSTTSAYGQVATKRIAVVGTGAVGSYYGGRIWESLRDQPNADVMFHLRNEHYDHCTEHGIDVTSYHGNFSIPAEELLAYSTTDEMAEAVNCLDDHKYFDWVVCSLKSTSLHEVPRLIEPLLSPDTRLLVIMNGLIEDDLIDFMRERRKARGLDGVGCKAIYAVYKRQQFC